jgi:hypothetical protein
MDGADGGDAEELVFVIPGRPAGPGPESIFPVMVMDSGFAGVRPRPGMTAYFVPYMRSPTSPTPGTI